jgi:hypothetical protein
MAKGKLYRQMEKEHPIKAFMWDLEDDLRFTTRVGLNLMGLRRR